MKSFIPFNIKYIGRLKDGVETLGGTGSVVIEFDDYRIKVSKNGELPRDSKQYSEFIKERIRIRIEKLENELKDAKTLLEKL